MMDSEGKYLIVRADAGTKIGTGHLMRCLALAQAWKDAGHKVVFITACQNENLLRRLHEEGFDTRPLTDPHPDSGDWTYTKDVLAAHPGAWVVLDGYHFDEVYQQQVKEIGHRLLAIDDMAHLKHYYADIILNQNLHAEQLQYSCEPYARLLLGTRYVLLRREFLVWKDWKREVPEIARRVLVTLGGADPENHTLKVIQALDKVEVTSLEATVIIGASNPHAEELEAGARQSRIHIQLVRDASNMPELVAWADVAIASAGTTCWELAWMGVPAALLTLADNQRRVAEELSRVGAATSLGRAHRVETPELLGKLVTFLNDNDGRAAIAEHAKALVDGEGVSRLLMLLKGEELRLRRVREQDCRLLWEWANDPEVRESSFSPAPITWEEHVRWFTARLNDPHCFHFIGVDENDLPLGQVRFDLQGDEAEIDVSVDRQRRGQRYGSSLIEIGAEEMLLCTRARLIHGYVKPQNEASIRAFTRAGFRDSGLEIVRGNQAVHLVKTKNAS